MLIPGAFSITYIPGLASIGTTTSATLQYFFNSFAAFISFTKSTSFKIPSAKSLIFLIKYFWLSSSLSKLLFPIISLMNLSLSLAIFSSFMPFFRTLIQTSLPDEFFAKYFYLFDKLRYCV